MKKNLIISAILLCTVWISYGQWTYDSLSEPRNWMAVTSFGTTAFFAGGETDLGESSKVETYDLETGMSYLGNLSLARSTLSAAVCDSLVFFAGGFVGTSASSVVDIWDMKNHQWSVAQLSVPRFALSAVSKGHKVLFAGGILYNFTSYNTVDIYDTQSGTWSTETLSLARGSMASAVVGDLALFAGGIRPGAAVTDRVDIYNFTTGIWSTATLSQARFAAEATTVGNKVLIAGGMTAGMASPSDVVDIYDAETNIWTTASLFEARMSAGAATINGKAYFAGGGSFASGAVLSDFSNVIDIYDAADSSWSVDFLSQPVASQSVVGIGNYLIVAGGKTFESLRVKTVQIFYDPYVPHIIHVPGDYPTIQEGIEAAEDGDTVLVADDTYYENINFIGKPILVASEFILDGDTNHINNTIIDGSQPANPDIGSVVTFESGEDTTSVLCGFTITGGTGTVEPSVNMRMGGGLHVKFSGGKFLNNHIHDNSVSYTGGVYGGGMQLGGPITEIPWIVLRGNRIYNNEAKSITEGASGGGFFCFYNLIMENNEISHNEANGHLGGDGGGVAIGGAFGLIEIDVHNNEVTYNEAKTDIGTNSFATLGGGMSFYWDVTGNVSNNVISFNSLEAPGTYWSWGPGVFIQDITSNGFVFENNRVIDNNTITTQTCRGGGVSLLRSGGKYQNNVIQNNSASHGGGIGIIISNEVGDTAILINNTITGNEATYGGGIYAMSSKAVIVNSIIWGNTATTGPAINLTESTLEVRYSDVQGDVVWPGEGNLNCTPTFLADGYHLDSYCQLVNEGIASVMINGLEYDCPAYDIDGEIRPYASTQPEIGADEVDFATSIGSVSVERLSTHVYPNPADQFVSISLKKDEVIKEVSIYNQVGQNVYRGLPDDNTLNVSKLQPGVYLIKVITNQSELKEKLIIE